MLWVLWDIVIPLVATFLLGLFVGWLLWRWRRSRIDADGLSQLRRSSARNKADVERLQQHNVELSDRLQAADGAGGGELVSARKRIDMLAEELKSSRREVAELKKTDRAEAAIPPASIAAGEAEIADLRDEIAARDRMIATLNTSLDQFGESGDTTTLMADIALRDRKIKELEALIATLHRN